MILSPFVSINTIMADTQRFVEPKLPTIMELPVPAGWEELFRVACKELVLVSKVIEERGPYYPLPQHVFRAS